MFFELVICFSVSSFVFLLWLGQLVQLPVAVFLILNGVILQQVFVRPGKVAGGFVVIRQQLITFLPEGRVILLSDGQRQMLALPGSMARLGFAPAA